MFDILQGILGAQWWLIMAIAIYGVTWGFYRDLYDHEQSRDRWIKDLRENYWGDWYRRQIRGALAWVDRRLPGPAALKSIPGPRIALAWSEPLLGLCLGLAVAYPILFALIQWGVTGQAVGLGAVELLAEQPSVWRRLAALLGLALAAASVCVVTFDPARTALAGLLWRYRQPTWLADPLVVACGAAGAVTGLITVASSGSGVVVTGAVFAVGFVAPSAVASAATFGVTLVSAGALSIAGAFAIAVARTFSGADAGSSAVAVAVAMVVVASALFFQRRRLVQRGRPSLCLALFALALLAAVALVATFVPVPAERAAEAASLLAFLALLPIANGLADYASIGLTRFLLARAVREDEHVPWEFLADAVGAVVILLALGGFVIWFGSSFGLSHGVPILDVAGLLTGVTERPAEHWWLYAALFSTLLPTVAHLALGSFGLVLRASIRLRRHIADDLAAAAAGDVVRGRWGVQWLCLTMTLTIMVPVGVVGHIVEHSDPMGCWLLEAFRAVAALGGVAGLEAAGCAPPPIEGADP